MPAGEIARRWAGLPLTGLLWAGVGLAPVAALLVLFAGDNTGVIRFAVLLAVTAVGLIGVAMVLRRDSGSAPEQFEDMLFEELDVLREDLRADITTAARATHKSFGERVVTLQESVNSLRGEFEHLRVRVERGGASAPSGSPTVPPVVVPPPRTAPVPDVAPPVAAPHGVVRHTETVKVTRHTIVDQHDEGRGAGTVYGGNRVAPERDVPAQRRPERSATPSFPGDDDSGESWSEQLMRERLADERRGGDRRDEARYGQSRYADERSGSHAWSAESGHGAEQHGGWRAPEPAGDGAGRVSGVQAGDRWASLRSDDRGREVRVGEWRAAAHTDESGSEVRIEDRWASMRMRRDEVRAPEQYREPERQWEPEREWERGRDAEPDWSREAQRGREAGRDRAGRAEESWSEPRLESSPGGPAGSWGGSRHDRGPARPALPAAPSEPSASSWMQGWDAGPDPVSERVRGRYSDSDEYRWHERAEEAGPGRPARGGGYDGGYGPGEDRWR
jgi:hypothetical protein